MACNRRVSSPAACRRAISRRPTMRWRGDRVRAREGQFGSQKPHSMHLSTSGSTAAIGLMFFRWASGSSLRMTPGLSKLREIEQRLDFPHQLVSLSPPFQLNEGGDVAAGAVFGFQRAVVLIHDHVAHIVHEVFVAFGFGRLGKVGGDDEMQIAFQGVAEDDGAGIAMLVEQALQVHQSSPPVGARDGDILDDHGGAGCPRRTHRGEQSLADRPQLGEFLRPVGELQREQGWRVGNGGGDGIQLSGQGR